MNLAAVNLDTPALRATLEEQPRVVRAIATEITNPQDLRQKVYYLACFIRHQDRDKRLAITKSDRAVAFAAQEMDDNLSAHGIVWDGSFRIGTPEQLAPTEDSMHAEAQAKKIILAD